MQLDTDRVLKNDFSDDMVDFIADEMNSFNDMQLIRSLLVLSLNHETKSIKKKYRVLTYLLHNIISGKFELKRGNTIAAFA